MWKRTGLEHDRIAYRQMCRTSNRLINKSRHDHYAAQIESANCCKDRWRTVNSLLHSGKKRTVHSSADNSKLCVSFSNYFADKIDKLKRVVASEVIALGTPRPAELHFTGLALNNLSCVTLVEVSKILTSIPAKSSPLDFIPTSLLKQCNMLFAEIIARLGNMSFSQGIFPTKYKFSVVTPLLKKPNLNSDVPANFRPISNLNNISKIIERLFLSRIQPHVCSSGNFSPTQSAYRRHHSTETALLHTLDYVYHSSDNRQPTIVVSLDFSSAFDTIDHAILLSRLNDCFGLSGNALAWVESYLQNRYQCVQLGQAASPYTLCLTGVPQGSVLGPLLFSCYVSPISSIASSHNVGIQQYADDTQLYIALKASESSTQLAQFSSCLSSLHDWFCHNGLSLYSSKSESILFGSSQRMCSFPAVILPSLAQLFPSQIQSRFLSNLRH